MTEKQALLAPSRYYLHPPTGRVVEIAGVAHLETEDGSIVIETADGPLTLTRVDFDAKRR